MTLGGKTIGIMEDFIMNSIEWKCSLVTSSEILDLLFTLYNDINTNIRSKAIMIIEFSLFGIIIHKIDFGFLKWKPSIVAYSAIIFACEILNEINVPQILLNHLILYHDKKYIVFIFEYI